MNCSTIETKKHSKSHQKYNEHDLFGELYEVSVDQDQGRTFSVSNISLVITYVTFIVGLTMLAGFIWLAFSAGSGDSHGGYGYNRRIFSEGISEWLFSGNFFDYGGDYKRHKRSSSFEFRDQGIIVSACYQSFYTSKLSCATGIDRILHIFFSHGK